LDFLLTYLKNVLPIKRFLLKNRWRVGPNGYPGSVGKAGWIGMKKSPVDFLIARRAENLIFSASLSNHSLNDFSSFKRKKGDEAKQEL